MDLFSGQYDFPWDHLMEEILFSVHKVIICLAYNSWKSNTTVNCVIMPGNNRCLSGSCNCAPRQKDVTVWWVFPSSLDLKAHLWNRSCLDYQRSGGTLVRMSIYSGIRSNETWTFAVMIVFDGVRLWAVPVSRDFAGFVFILCAGLVGNAITVSLQKV